MLRLRTIGCLNATLAAAFALSGCAVEWTREHRLFCGESEKSLISETLYFGMSIPGGGQVGVDDWKRFEHDVLSAGFPQGFTVIESHGTWRGASGEIVAEPSRVVRIVHEDDGASETAIRTIVERYRTKFHQEAVLRERSIACVTF